MDQGDRMDRLVDMAIIVAIAILVCTFAVISFIY